LSAKIEIDPSSEARLSIRNVLTIASAPIISGSSAATRLRKKRSESRKRRGKASISAICRSFSTCWFTCSLARANPPTRTSSSPLRSSRIRSEASCSSLSSVGLRLTAR
jgi:hypothetical protein